MVGPEALSSRDTQSLGKVPPHSLEAEEALLGSACLLYTSPSPRDGW